MIRLLIHSQDINLQFALAPAVGAEFSICLERRTDRIRELIAQGQCDVLILDLDSRAYTIPQQLGFCEEIRELDIPVVVMMCGEGTVTALELAQRGLYNYIRKPAALPELAILVRRAHEFAVLKREVVKREVVKREMEESGKASGSSDTRFAGGCAGACSTMIGSGPGAMAVYDLIRRVADPDVPVLITGETGTGKELIARRIHSTSTRSGQPFVAVSCGAIPETLIEAELFGAEKGAYTGAAVRRKGYLEEAGNGTLFFDEIGELSAHTQVRLLRVLQQREFTRLGSNQPIPLQARLLFATHRNLLEMVEEGTFRQDLYYRVNVMGIRAPALRDRAEDIPELARHFLNAYSRLYKRPIAAIATDAMALLVDYDWPGNVRELENVVQSAILLSDCGIIQPGDLPEALQQTEPLHQAGSLARDSFEEQLQGYKIKLAQRAIHECKGNKTLAARSLSISRTYLHRLIRNPLEAADILSASAPN